MTPVSGMPVGGERDAGAVRVSPAHTLTVARLEGQQHMTIASENPLEFRDTLVEGSDGV